MAVAGSSGLIAHPRPSIGRGFVYSHLRCWQTFVLACQYLCMPILSKTDILMHKLLAGRFVWDVEFPSDFRDHFMPLLYKRKLVCLRSLL